MNKHTIYILTRGRLSYLKEAIQPLLIQSNNQFTLIISDSSASRSLSETQEIKNLIKKKLNSLYLKRSRHNSLWEHIRECVLECESEYITLLHDDDIICKNYVNWVNTILDRNRNISAVASNSVIIDQQGQYIRHSSESKEDLIIIKSDDLVEKYFRTKSLGIACFPFYTYNRKMLEQVMKINLTCGIYSDVEILMRLINTSKGLYWGSEVLASYRQHSTNMSARESISDRVSLLKLIEFSCSNKTAQVYKNWLFSRIVINSMNYKNIFKNYRMCLQLKILNTKALIELPFHIWFLVKQKIKKNFINSRNIKIK